MNGNQLEVIVERKLCIKMILNKVEMNIEETSHRSQ